MNELRPFYSRMAASLRTRKFAKEEVIIKKYEEWNNFILKIITVIHQIAIKRHLIKIIENCYTSLALKFPFGCLET